MYAQVRFQVPTKVRLPVVPATTCQTRPDGAFMFTVDKEHRAHLHKVFVGRDLGGSFEIASGINVGDLVIINPSDEIRDNMEVTPTIVELPKAEKDKK
jgi:multidrug efflux pump subunit AcrA (membrane-fusion protein)